jgi:dienelactone hydrolase
MRRLPIVIAALIVAASRALAGEPVEIPNGDVKLRAALFRPAGNGPFPAVVALHTCDGLFDPEGQVFQRYQDWADQLTAAGFAVIFPDSFGSRGLGSQCKVREPTVRASRLRTTDANTTRAWLQAQPWIVADRVSLLGWSHGATTALWTARRRATKEKTPDFRSAVALYPNCRNSAISAWSARIPTLILIGRADDWTPANVCEQMIAGARGRSAMATLLVYPGAYHDFDTKEKMHERTGIANTANAAGRVHVGTDELARADAFKRVPAWFAR